MWSRPNPRTPRWTNGKGVFIVKPEDKKTFRVVGADGNPAIYGSFRTFEGAAKAVKKYLPAHVQ